MKPFLKSLPVFSINYDIRQCQIVGDELKIFLVITSWYKWWLNEDICKKGLKMHNIPKISKSLEVRHCHKSEVLFSYICMCTTDVYLYPYTLQ